MAVPGNESQRLIQVVGRAARQLTKCPDLVALLQRSPTILCLLAICYVGESAVRTDHPTVGVEDSRCKGIAPAVLTAPRQKPKFEPTAVRGLCSDTQERGEGNLAILWMDEVETGPAQSLVRGEPGHTLPGGVEERPAALVIDQEDHILDVVNDRAITGFADAQSLLRPFAGEELFFSAQPCLALTGTISTSVIDQGSRRFIQSAIGCASCPVRQIICSDWRREVVALGDVTAETCEHLARFSILYAFGYRFKPNIVGDIIERPPHL